VNAEERLIVDANVVVKWFVQEEYWEAALALSQGPALLAPELLLAEAGNAFVKKIRRREMSEADVRGSLARIPSMVTLLDSTPLASEALDIAARYQCSFYDSLYVALALQQQCRVVTADERLFNALQAHLRPTMVWIEDVRQV
jgi:predicted nucleic acid-binding protein